VNDQLVPGTPEMDSYVRIWCETLAAVLGQSVGQSLPLAIQTGEPAAPLPAEFFLNITMAGTLRGEQALGLTSKEARWLANAFTGEAQPEASAAAATPAITPDQSEAVEELFRQVAGRATSTLKAIWGEVQIHVQAGSAPSWPAATTTMLQTPSDSAPHLGLELRISAALQASLRDATAQATAAASTPTAAALGANTGDTPAPGAVNLDFLKNVPLDLTLRFGQRCMALREILELGPGSVIELDRHLKEPVDLLLDGQVLARGEVVVIQGCYGLRVTQIAARGGVER
jgi:flagellar motor switch protein FliN